MTQEELDKDMIESIEMWLHEIEPKWVEKELAWLEELRTRLLKEETPNGLEEAADNHIREVVDAGAKWQKEQDDKELSDLLTIAHLQGAEQMKEQMMKEAREADVNTYRDLAAGKSWAEFVVEKPPKNLGDKVRIIIVKEDEK